VNSSGISYVARKIAQLSFLLCLCSFSGCESRQEKTPLSETGTGSIVGVNYTGNGIQGFTVDDASGSNIGSYSGGGGFVCCASYPKTWVPTFKVTVKWRRSDGREPSGERWRIKALEQVVAVEKYVVEGNVYVLFLPEDKVKVYVSVVGVGNPNFPNNPGYPEDAEKPEAMK
jgi:hypothetical protein